MFHWTQFTTIAEQTIYHWVHTIHSVQFLYFFVLNPKPEKWPVISWISLGSYLKWLEFGKWYLSHETLISWAFSDPCFLPLSLGHLCVCEEQKAIRHNRFSPETQLGTLLHSVLLEWNDAYSGTMTLNRLICNDQSWLGWSCSRLQSSSFTFGASEKKQKEKGKHLQLAKQQRHPRTQRTTEHQ